MLNSKSEYSRCSLPRLSIDVEKWRKKKLEAEQATKLATETVGLEVSDLTVNEEAAFRTEEEKRKISQVGYNRRIKTKNLRSW